MTNFVNSIVLTGISGGCAKASQPKNDEPYAFSSIAVKRPEPSKVNDYFTIVGFGEVASKIALFTKGTPISVRGRLEANRYTDKNGMTKESYRVIVEDITRVVE